MIARVHARWPPRRLPAGGLGRPRGRCGHGGSSHCRVVQEAGSAIPRPCRWPVPSARTAADGDGADRRHRRRAQLRLDWGLVNRVVPAAELDSAVDDLLARATRGSAASKAWGKQVLYAQLDRPENDAYGDRGCRRWPRASQSAGAREGRSAFLEKRRAAIHRLSGPRRRRTRGRHVIAQGVAADGVGRRRLGWAGASRDRPVFRRLRRPAYRPPAHGHPAAADQGRRLGLGARRRPGLQAAELDVSALPVDRGVDAASGACATRTASSW